MRFFVAASLAVVGLGSSCVENDGSVFIEGMLPLSPADDCEVDAGGEVFVSSGRLDLLQGVSFTAPLKVITNLPSTFNNTDVTKGDTQSPNYPDYGSTDNNVIIFDAAETTFSFQVAQEVADAADPEIFECNDQGLCETNQNQPTVTPAAGSVFNTQTQLNSANVVFVEAISDTFAQTLRDNLADELSDPSKSVRVVVNVTLQGSTTGNGALRPLRTFPFPLPVDVCVGCLTPNQEFCTNLNGSTFQPVVGGAACIDGQDFRLGECI